MLLVDDDARVRTLTLNRPDALNAFNEALYDATTEALRAANDDPSVAVVLLTGAGRAFSAGTDLLEMGEVALVVRFTRNWIHYGLLGHTVVCILIAAVEGLLGR